MLELDFLCQLMSAIMGAILYFLCALFDLLLSSLYLMAQLMIVCLCVLFICAIFCLAIFMFNEGLIAMSNIVGALSVYNAMMMLLCGGIYAGAAIGLAIAALIVLIENFNLYVMQPLYALIGGVTSVILAPIYGAAAGWMYGVDGVFQTVLDYIDQANFYSRPDDLHRAPYLLFSNLVIPAVLAPLAPHERALRPYTLSLADWDALRGAPRGLTSEERRECIENRNNHPELDRLYPIYVDRLAFINPYLGCPIHHDASPLTAHRAPDENDPNYNHKAMLLVKQSLGHDGAWHAVPGQSFLFSESGLINMLESDARNGRDPLHPFTRDSLNHPAPVNGAQTRYIIHPLFDDAAQPIISQELNEIAAAIHPSLRAAVYAVLVEPRMHR